MWRNILRRSRARTPRTMLALIFSCACSAGNEPAAVTTFQASPLGVAASTSGAFTVTMFPQTGGVARGLDSIEIVVTDPNDAPVDGLAIDLVPWMPAMGHGTSTIPDVKPTGAGHYVASDVALIMPGEWQLRATLTANEEAVIDVAVQ